MSHFGRPGHDPFFEVESRGWVEGKQTKQDKFHYLDSTFPPLLPSFKYLIVIPISSIPPLLAKKPGHGEEEGKMRVVVVVSFGFGGGI